MDDKPNQQLQVVFLEWFDAFSDRGWCDQKELQEHVLDIEHWVRECGFIIREDEKSVVFCSSWVPENKPHVDNLFGNIQKIPKTWVRNRYLLATVDGSAGEAILKRISADDQSLEAEGAQQADGAT